MRISIAAAGRLKGGPELALIEDYAARIRGLGKGLGVSAFEIREIEAPKGLTGPKRQAREGELLAGAAPPASRRIVLDERGKSLSSEDFAALIGKWRDEGCAELAFFIGGADGHSHELSASADVKLSFGRATWPHMLARAMLVEQIYRALTILAGHPYHRS
ncbi:MAG: 23S rRNA (pseudouridine(1915)-N(3))-methyltransferase RlmH [Parvularculaceae bacterium]|nr:23S rRNA (pseudouridine(1915)-N(3))-methyltransferase RlmH [Parvularculaceae bacterium]